jgi:hypothetical protein
MGRGENKEQVILDEAVRFGLDHFDSDHYERLRVSKKINSLVKGWEYASSTGALSMSVLANTLEEDSFLRKMIREGDSGYIDSLAAYLVNNAVGKKPDDLLRNWLVAAGHAKRTTACVVRFRDQTLHLRLGPGDPTTICLESITDDVLENAAVSRGIFLRNPHACERCRERAERSPLTSASLAAKEQNDWDCLSDGDRASLSLAFQKMMSEQMKVLGEEGIDRKERLRRMESLLRRDFRESAYEPAALVAAKRVYAQEKTSRFETIFFFERARGGNYGLMIQAFKEAVNKSRGALPGLAIDWPGEEKLAEIFLRIPRSIMAFDREHFLLCTHLIAELAPESLANYVQPGWCYDADHDAREIWDTYYSGLSYPDPIESY